MSGKPAENIDDAERPPRLTPQQKLAVVNEFFGSVAPIEGFDSINCTDFLYGPDGMPGSDD